MVAIADLAQIIPIEKAPSYDPLLATSPGRGYYDFFVYKSNLLTHRWLLTGIYQYPNCLSLKEIFESSSDCACREVKEVIYLDSHSYVAILIQGTAPVKFSSQEDYSKDFYLPINLLGKVSSDLSVDVIAEVAYEFFGEDICSIQRIYFPNTPFFNEQLWSIDVTGYPTPFC